MVKEMSADELEAACRKCARVKVSDVKTLARVLDSMKIEYTVLPNNEADVFAEIQVSELTRALDKENCELYSLREHDESLEAFYIGLVGGEKHE